MSTCISHKVNDLPTSTTPGSSPGEALSKRCVMLVRTALKPEIWPSELAASCTQVIVVIGMYVHEYCVVCIVVVLIVYVIVISVVILCL